jgi:limonene-1,2-epoxide hydrolase
LATPTKRRTVGITNIGVTNEKELAMTTNTGDRLEIANLLARLARTLDDGRHDAIRTVYTDDVVVRSPRGELHGIDEVAAFLRRFRVDGEHTHHVTGSVLVTADEDRGAASASQLVYYYRDDEPPHRTSGLRVSYAAVRTPAGWRFREGRITLAWTRES